MAIFKAALLTRQGLGAIMNNHRSFQSNKQTLLLYTPEANLMQNHNNKTKKEGKQR